MDSSSRFLHLLPADDLVRSYKAFDVAGIKVIVSPNCPLANADADRSGAIFSGKPALGLAELEWMTVGEETDQSQRATEFVSVCTYAATEINGASAVAFETDA